MALSDGLQGCLEIGEGFDVVELRGFDQGRDDAPGSATFVVPREERILAIEGNRADQVFDFVGT